MTQPTITPEEPTITPLSKTAAEKVLTLIDCTVKLSTKHGIFVTDHTRFIPPSIYIPFLDDYIFIEDISEICYINEQDKEHPVTFIPVNWEEK